MKVIIKAMLVSFLAVFAVSCTGSEEDSSTVDPTETTAEESVAPIFVADASFPESDPNDDPEEYDYSFLYGGSGEGAEKWIEDQGYDARVIEPGNIEIPEADDNRITITVDDDIVVYAVRG